MESQVVQPKDTPGGVRGVGLYSTSCIRSGQLVLSEAPILVYPQASMTREVCGHCLRDVPVSEGVSCSCCGQMHFCTKCAAVAAQDPGSHTPFICSMYRSCRKEGASDEILSSLHYLCRSLGLLHACVLGDEQAHLRWQGLLELSTGNMDFALQNKEQMAIFKDVCDRILPAVGALPVELQNSLQVHEEALVSLLLRDIVNSYGIRAPARLISDSCSIRGTGLYKISSRVNHECLPNVARCEDFDRAYDPESPGRNTWMEFRALHDLPAGEEITQSYFPLMWDAEERQGRCMEIYGFQCRCPRCAEECPHLQITPEVAADQAYISVFLLKYMCPHIDCEGTMVPVFEDSDQTLRCNVCSAARTEAQFLAELESDVS